MSEKKDIKLTEKEKENLRLALGPLPNSALDEIEDMMNAYETTQKLNVEKAKIMLGEEYVKKQLEENPDAIHSFHFSEPYKSMSLEEMRRLRKLGLL